MRRARIGSVVTLALSLAVLSIAGACTIGQVQSYIDLGNTGCGVGPYTFYNFGFSQSQTGGAMLPALDSITIDPLPNDSTIGPYGGPFPPASAVLILGNWNADTGQSVTYSLSFSIALTQGGDLKGELYLGDTVPSFPASIPKGDTWGTTTVLGFNGGEITGSNLFTFTFDAFDTEGGGFFQPLVCCAGNLYDLSHTPFVDIKSTKILQSNSGNIQDLGSWSGIDVAFSDAPEPGYLLVCGLFLIVFAWCKHRPRPDSSNR
jgi:hypothetical protein